MNVMDKYDNILIEYKEQIKKLQEKNAILKIELQEIKEDIKKYTAPKSNNHKKEKIQCVKKRINCEEEIIYNQSRIIIFDTNVVKNKKFIGFQGYGCNVKLCIGRIQIECYDHEISCYLVQSQIHNIELIIQPYENIMDIKVKLFWSDKYINNRFIIDETLDEILAPVRYRYRYRYFDIKMLLCPFFDMAFFIREKWNTKAVKVAPILDDNNLDDNNLEEENYGFYNI
jgi:hypothetical protein